MPMPHLRFAPTTSAVPSASQRAGCFENVVVLVSMSSSVSSSKSEHCSGREQKKSASLPAFEKGGEDFAVGRREVGLERLQVGALQHRHAVRRGPHALGG